jgi:outer membrane protein assembly factor BamB
MKLKPILLSLISLLAFGLLTACAGGSAVNSWPGMTVDTEREVVYIAYNTAIHAVNLTNGTETWRYPAKAENGKLFFASPALTQDSQLIIAGYNKILYSLDPGNGTEKWSFAQASNRYIAAPLVTADKIFAPSADGYLYALDLNGNLLWKYKTQHGQWGTPAANEQNVFLPSMDHRVYALEIGTGALVWKSEDLGGAVASQPVLDSDGVLYVGTLLPEVVAIQKDSGNILWRTPTVGWVWASPVLKDGVLYVADLSGTVYALKAEDGSIIWKYQPVAGPKNTMPSTPLIYEDTLYVVSENGNLYAVDVANGNPRWTKTFTSKLYVGPYLAGDTILIAQLGSEGLLVALDLSGNQKWAFIPGK